MSYRKWRKIYLTISVTHNSKKMIHEQGEIIFNFKPNMVPSSFMGRTDTLINYCKPTLTRRPREDIPNSCSGLICLKATIIPDKIPVIPLNCRNLQIQKTYK